MVRGSWAVAAILILMGSNASATPVFQLVVPDYRATQPAINDSGEVVYAKDLAVYSTVRGLLVPSGVDASNVDVADNGEGVWADGSGNSHILSTIRGSVVSSRSYGPTIAATSGEVAYVGVDSRGQANIFTTKQGQISFADGRFDNVYSADVNDQGYDLQLTAYAAESWRATFFVTGMAHSIVKGSAYEPTPWRAVQHAAWEALTATEV